MEALILKTRRRSLIVCESQKIVELLIVCFPRKSYDFLNK